MYLQFHSNFPGANELKLIQAMVCHLFGTIEWMNIYFTEVFRLVHHFTCIYTSSWISHTITWTNTDILSVGSLGTNFSDVQRKYGNLFQANAFKNVVCKMSAILHRSEWANITILFIVTQIHQDLSRSYKEVCAPVIERCHFLFNELRPAIGNEANAVSRSQLLKSSTRWKEVIYKVISQVKKRKKGKGNIDFNEK